VSSLARIEVPAAFWRKYRKGEISAADAAVLTSAFERDWFEGSDAPPFAVVAPTPDVLDRAAQAAALHGLRAYDAIQLATAAVARAADPDIATFACFDLRLAHAARIEGFATIPEESVRPPDPRSRRSGRARAG
jgi:uncharacterized protein